MMQRLRVTPTTAQIRI